MVICNIDYCRGSQVLSAEVQIWSGKVQMSFHQQNFDIKGLEIRGIVRNVTSQDAVVIVVEIPIIRCWELFSGCYFNPITLPVPC
jgi:hypothetical protein